MLTQDRDSRFLLILLAALPALATHVPGQVLVCLEEGQDASCLGIGARPRLWPPASRNTV